MTLLRQVMSYLEERDIACALIGASAMVPYGVVRSTFDLDLLTVDGPVLAKGFWAALEAGGITADVRRGDDSDPLRGLVRITRGDSDRPLDVIVGRYAWQERAVARATPLIPGEAIHVVQLSDLILLKLYAGGPQDAWDVRELLKGPEAARARQQVELDLEALPPRSADLWRRLTSDEV